MVKILTARAVSTDDAKVEAVDSISR
jgi:hypothetical protein